MIDRDLTEEQLRAATAQQGEHRFKVLRDDDRGTWSTAPADRAPDDASIADTRTLVVEFSVRGDAETAWQDAIRLGHLIREISLRAFHEGAEHERGRMSADIAEAHAARRTADDLRVAAERKYIDFEYDVLSAIEGGLGIMTATPARTIREQGIVLTSALEKARETGVLGETCPTCAGSGDGSHGSCSIPECDHSEDCETCGGTGNLPTVAELVALRARADRTAERDRYGRLASLYTECELLLRDALPEGISAPHFKDAVNVAAMHLRADRQHLQAIVAACEKAMGSQHGGLDALGLVDVALQDRAELGALARSLSPLAGVARDEAWRAAQQAVEEATSVLGRAAVRDFIDGHAKRLAEQAGACWSATPGEEKSEWASVVHDVLNHLWADDDGEVHDGRVVKKP